jgi:hypothetical protein
MVRTIASKSPLLRFTGLKIRFDLPIHFIRLLLMDLFVRPVSTESKNPRTRMVAIQAGESAPAQSEVEIGQWKPASLTSSTLCSSNMRHPLVHSVDRTEPPMQLENILVGPAFGKRIRAAELSVADRRIERRGTDPDVAFAQPRALSSRAPEGTRPMKDPSDRFQ